MRLQLTLLVRLACLLCAWLWLGAAPAAADESSGVWSGALQGRGNYYWERSTRVMVPELKLKLTSPSGVRVGASYLVDVISSASIAQNGAKQDSVGQELRHGVALEAGKEIDLGRVQLDFTLTGTYSNESDYKSLSYGLLSSLAFDEKNTKISLAVTRVQDEVLSNADKTLDKDLTGFSIAPAIEHVISPELVLTVGYQLAFLEGFLANPYRRALLGPLPKAEDHPHQRVRNGASARLIWFIPQSSTAVHLMYGAYADSWNIAALTPELRIYQRLTNDLLLRARYRFYAQSAAFFERARCGESISETSEQCKNIPPGAYPKAWTGYVTNDPKMAAMRTHTAGLSIEYHLSALAGTALDFAKDTWLDIAFDRYWSTSAFGNGIIGTAGGRLLF